jgi:hypothetical protein
MQDVPRINSKKVSCSNFSQSLQMMTALNKGVNQSCSKTSQECLALFDSLGRRASKRGFCRVALAFFDRCRLCLVSLLFHALANSLLSFTNTQGSITSQSVVAATQKIATGTSDLLGFELSWVPELRISANEGSCWSWACNVHLGLVGFIASESRDNYFVDLG